MRGHAAGPAAGEQLAWADRRRLARALAAARVASVYRRLEAVLLVAEGESLSEAARRVRAARLSVQRWVARYLAARDPRAVVDGTRPGRPRVAAALTPEHLATLVATDPRVLGYRATAWTAPLLAHHLRAREGIALSERTLRRRLHERHYRWKRPRHVYHRRAAHVGQKKGA